MTTLPLNLHVDRPPLDLPEATSLLEKVTSLLLTDTRQRGGLLDLRDEVGKELILIGDLHGRIENLLKILRANGNLSKLEQGKLIVVCLGDAVHNEPRRLPVDDIELEWITNMDSSVRIIQLLMELKRAFPKQVYYLLGNHDHLTIKYSKFGVRQGWEFRNHLKRIYGDLFVEQYRHFIAASPLLMIGSGIVANHAGPLSDRYKLDMVSKPLVAANEDDPVVEQLEWRRWKHRSRTLAYQERDVKNFLKKVIGQPQAVYLVGHSPHLLLDPKYRVNAFTARMMPGHYMIFAGHNQTGYASFVNGAAADSIRFINTSDVQF